MVASRAIDVGDLPSPSDPDSKSNHKLQSNFGAYSSEQRPPSLTCMQQHKQCCILMLDRSFNQCVRRSLDLETPTPKSRPVSILKLLSSPKTRLRP